MRRIPSWDRKILLTLATMTVVVFLLVRAVGAQNPRFRLPMISDWSHRHLVFSQPASWVQAWKLQGDPRYFQQIVRRRGRPAAEAESQGPRLGFPGLDWRQRQREKPFERDWGQSLGAGGTTGAPLVSPNWYPAFPAKFSFDINTAPDCINDYVAFPTNLTGTTGGQASIIAYNNLYKGSLMAFCTGLSFEPSVYWSYNTNFSNVGTATTGMVATSPVLSADGTKVAFVETRTVPNGGAVLHLLKWNAGDGGAINTAAAPARATVWTADGAAGHCPTTGACMISLLLSGPQSDTGSSPYYDYARDTLYVGDDNGVLHKFVNVFGITGTTPAEVLTGSWPITVDTGRILTSPILDSVSGNIFAADSGGQVSYVRETFSSAGICAAGVPPCVGSTTIVPAAAHVIPDAPIVDPVTEKIFVFYGNDGTAGGSSVLQSDITLSVSVSATLGSGTGHHLHSGAFDNSYLTGNGSTGHLYMCGSSSTSAPTIQRIGFTNTGRTPASPFANPTGTMNAAVDSVTLAVATASAECSPVTEFFNVNAPAASQDQIFFGVQDFGSGGSCAAGGCVMSMSVTGTPATLTIGASIAEVNGPSGIIVDNNANTNVGAGNFPQASSLYFSRQGNSTATNTCDAVALLIGVGCAIKLTQSGLN